MKFLFYFTSLLLSIALLPGCESCFGDNKVDSRLNQEQINRDAQKAANESTLSNILNDLKDQKTSIEEFKKFCERNPKLCKDYKPSYGQNLLHIAIDYKNLQLVEYIVEKFPDLVKKTEGNNYLFVSIYRNNNEIASAIAKKVPKELLREKNGDGQNVLTLALQRKNYTLAKQILEEDPTLADEPAVLSADTQEKITPRIDIEKLAPEAKKVLLSVINAKKAKDFDNEFLSFKDNIYTIKKIPSNPMFFDSEGKIIGFTAYGFIPYEDIFNTKHVLISQTDPFVELYENNVFKNLPINLPSPNIWGRDLTLQKKEHGGIVFSLAKEDLIQQKKILSDKDFNENFPNITSSPLLGKGGLGAVYSFKSSGRDFALKIAKSGTNFGLNDELFTEYLNLDKLQFTGAVVNIYGFFTNNKNEYLLMEQGQKDLSKIIEAKEDVSDDLLIETVDRFIVLNKAAKELGVKYNDIKPHNFILTKDNSIKAIDINKGYTEGYTGTSGELLARVILALYLKEVNPINLSILQEQKPIANRYLRYFYQYYCKENNYDDCEKINTYQDLYEKIPKEIRIQLVFDYEKRAYPGYSFDVDVTTGLRIPQFIDDETILDWKPYFEKIEIMAEEYCISIMQKKPSSRESSDFICRKNVPDFSFRDKDDQKFQDFVVNYFFDMIAKQKLWSAILETHNRPQQNKIFRSLITKSIKNSVLQEKLLELYDSN